MPAESYIPTDVKITVEKPVKPKPSLAELTKVETPGRPSPADMLEDSPKLRIILSEKLANKLIKQKKFRISHVVEYPTSDRTELEDYPLN